jgi:hypothetical protein
MTKLCDESGRTIGFFLTVAEQERIQKLEEENRRLLYERAKAQVTDEELDKAEQETETYSTEEVLRYLEQR